MKILSILCAILLVISCKNDSETLSAQDIVDKSIAVSCNNGCDNVIIEFDFRNKKYRSERKEGSFMYERITNDSSGITLDRLSNDGFVRFMNDSVVTLSDSLTTIYSNSVNSVHYFVQLPYLLNDPAAKKELLGEAIIKNEPYYEIGVAFKEEGGGTDHDDTFVYWIHKESWTVDYLAYKYATDGGGIRFREAYNPREIKGIRFVDYNNFKPENLQVPLIDLDKHFEEGKLQLLSKIETENVRVILPDS